MSSSATEPSTSDTQPTMSSAGDIILVVLMPTLSWAWALLLVLTAAIYVLALRPLAHDRREQTTVVFAP